MNAARGASAPTIALAGNPNSGKSTLFNKLTGLSQRVGNYPGVTVERKTGRLSLGNKEATVVDLPGTYSLVSRSREEAIALEVLRGKTGPAPDLIVLVIDASNLERNLYFALQVLELGRPAILALNMIDVAEEAGIHIDAEGLSKKLGVPVVKVVAKNGLGVPELKAVIERAIETPHPGFVRQWKLDPESEAHLDAVKAKLPAGANSADAAWLVATVKARDDAQARGTADDPLLNRPELAGAVALAEEKLQNGAAHLPASLIEARYHFIDELTDRAIDRKPTAGPTITDRIDAILLHRLLGPVTFALVMLVVFQSIFTWAQPMMDGIESLFGDLGSLIGSRLPEGALKGLLVDGVITGVGAVLVFIPQIAILFFLIGMLEDSGYLARAAYIMDRVMAKVGLHGRAFVPLMSGFACAIPAIMAARTIESSRDRLVTILVTPLMSCSARLPIYTLIISALFGGQTIAGVLSVGAVLMLAMYLLSVLSAVLVAFVLKKTLLRSPTPPLVLELPPYKMPQLFGVLRRVLDRCKVFVRDAGTVILACSIVLWALLHYPAHSPLPQDLAAAEASRATLDPDAQEKLDDAIAAARLQQSYGARAGRLLEPAIAPLGFDWKIGIGLIGSFAAREVIVSTLGLVYGLGKSSDEGSEGLRAVIQGAYTPLTGLSLMVFFLFACQCMSTLAIVRRETGTLRWPVFLFGYMTAMAWVASFIVYQGGRAIGLG
ncbi:MAG: ferrous iron transport protein B [Myxococcota bacterium]